MNKFLQSICLVLIAIVGNSYAQTFTSTPVTTGTSGTPYTYSITATEASNNPLTFTAPTLPSWLTFSASGQNTYSTFGAAITQPIGVTADNNGNTYATTYSGPVGTPIYKIAPDGTTTAWATRQAGNPYSMAVHNGYLYLSYYTNNTPGSSFSKITKIDLNNPAAGESVVVTFPTNGACIGITFYQGDLYVAMYSTRTIAKVNLANGTYSTFVSNISSNPWGLGFDSTGKLYIATYSGASIQKWDGSTLTTVLSGIGNASDIKFDNSGYLYISSAGGGVRKYKADLSSYTQVVPTSVGAVYGMTLTTNGTLVFSLFSQNTCARIQTGAVLTGTPAISDIGVHNVSVNVTNGTTTANQSFAITVTGPSTYTAPSNITKNYGDASFTITDPSSNSNGAFSYTSSNSAVATTSGNTVNIIGKGTATITATQAASGL
ncbi:MAG: Ig-like domain-containing protein, partial [Pyrinomonadaceae bacterium]|nr:Ig-like domain-containing protein [Sphingobacteriaceae bacterium]